MKNNFVNEELTTIVNILTKKKNYDLEIKNLQSLNKPDFLNSIVVKVNKGDAEQLAKEILNIYDVTVEINKELNTLLIKIA